MGEKGESFEECMNRINNKIDNKIWKKKIKFSKKSPLEKLAEAIKNKVDKEGGVEGTISYEIISYIKGTGVSINRSYNFLGKLVEETALYDNKYQAENEAFKDGLEDIIYFVKPYRVTYSGNNVFVKAPKKDLSKAIQLTLFR